MRLRRQNFSRSNVNFIERARLPLAHSVPVTHGDSAFQLAEFLKARPQRTVAPGAAPRILLAPLSPRRNKDQAVAGGSVDFVRKIAACCREETFPRGPRNSLRDDSHDSSLGSAERLYFFPRGENCAEGWGKKTAEDDLSLRAAERCADSTEKQDTVAQASA